MNKIILSGRLCADPELRTTQSGVETCSFTVAVDRKFANKQTGERETDFISCTAWRQTASFIARYFTKGKMIVVEGSLRTGSYKDKNHSDVTHYTTDVMVDNVEFAGDKGMNATGQASANPSTKDAPAVNDLSDYEEILSDGDIPF